MATTYTVKKGDTLSQIAISYNTTVAKLVEWNDITNPDYIVVGQVLTVAGGTATTTKTSKSQATIKAFGLQSNTDRTVYATWAWSQTNTENYQVIWYYDTGDGVWFEGTNTTVTAKQSTYNAPSNAVRTKFKVKPNSKTYQSGKKTRTYWTAKWSTESTYNFSDNPPSAPPTPNVEVTTKRKLTASLSNLNVNADNIQFQIIKDDVTVYKSSTVKIKTGSASYSVTVPSGSRYKVRCRAYRSTTKEYGAWSDYSDNHSTVPYAPASIKTCRATSATSVYLEWEPVETATSYEIEYTTKKEYFDGSDQTTTQSSITNTHYEKTGLETGSEYFFRLRATNDKGSSVWSSITSVVIGKDPSAPTTWSSTTTAIVDDNVTLYWVHNAEDGSSQTVAELELVIGGKTTVKTIQNSTDEEEKDKTSFYVIDTSEYDEGTKIQWRVRTAGVTKVYGDWSVQRTIDVYAQPTLELNVTDPSGNMLEKLESFPIHISAIVGPETQEPIGFHLVVTSTETYETVDEVGSRKIVSANQTVYSEFFDISEDLDVDLSASDIDLENNITYKLTCTVTMNSGLTTEDSIEFTVGWAIAEYEPNAEIIFDENTYTASIRPYCEDDDGDLVEGVTLSVYRREFDGGFTELASEIDNTSNTYITDPHPALDFARYRVVAIDDATGAVSYYDVPGYPVGGKSIIIQWDEEWTSFNTWNDDVPEEESWGGSILKLPYNIDVSDSNDADVSMVEYIGRSHPVGYYGTQLGSSSTWNVSIEKKDEETLYALRRLSRWLGDVYVREPSGSGYWASIKVSFSQKHCDLVVPVTLSITRVEGGI